MITNIVGGKRIGSAMTNSARNVITQLVTRAWQRDRARQQREAERIAQDVKPADLDWFALRAFDRS
jgi:hypothetical protein